MEPENGKGTSPQSPHENGDFNIPQENSEKTKDVLRKSKELATPPIDPKTLLFFDAIREGSVQKVKTLLRNKTMTMNTRDFNQPHTPTALIAACEANKTEIVQLFLSAKKAKTFDVNLEDTHGRRPIW